MNERNPNEGPSSPHGPDEQIEGFAHQILDTSYQRWSDQALTDGLALVVPTVDDGETVFRFCFVNPMTVVDDIEVILDAMR